MTNGKCRLAGLLVLAVAAVGALGGCGSSEADRAEEPSRGGREVLDKAIWGPVEMPDGASAFPVYERLGVDTFQMQLVWAEIAPSRPVDATDPGDPAYRWPADVDAAAREAPGRGIDLALLVRGSPDWANGGRALVQAPDDPSDYADFLTAAARRYPQVRRWMVWGEPNRGDRFLPNVPDDPRGPRRYAQLLDAAYGALKAKSRRNVVIGGNTFTGGDIRPPDFIRWMRLPSGRPPRLDWYGHNPYPFRFPNLADTPLPGGWRDLSDLDTLGDEIDAAYRPLGIQPRLWLSEFTVQSGQDSRYFAYHVSEAEQVRWLRAGYATAAQAGNVAGLGWFTLLDQPPGPTSANWGLMTASGAPKPAFAAYASR